MNKLGLDAYENMKVRTASVRIVANFGSQILHLPRFLTPLAISRKFPASPLRGFLCNTKRFLPNLIWFSLHESRDQILIESKSYLVRSKLDRINKLKSYSDFMGELIGLLITIDTQC